MAGTRTQRSSRQNPSPTGEDELTGAAPRALTNDSGTPSHTPAVSRVLIPAPAPSSAPAKLVDKYTNANLQRATKLALELFVQGQQEVQSQMALPVLEPQEWPLKAWFPDFYYGNSHIDCYRFY